VRGLVTCMTVTRTVCCSVSAGALRAWARYSKGLGFGWGACVRKGGGVFGGEDFEALIRSG
jgi:hypothetical protein